jgi:hypothetical protein
MSAPGAGKQDRPVIYIFTLFGAVTAVLNIAGNFFPISGTWGFHQTAFLPLSIRITVPLLMLLLLVPAGQIFILGRLERISEKFSGKSKQFRQSLIAAIAAAVILFLWLLREKFFLTGDGSLIIRLIDNQQPGSVDVMAFSREPLSGYILIKLSKLIPLIFPSLPVESSIQAAVIFIATVSLILTWLVVHATTEDRTAGLLLYGTIISSGALSLLFGYIEAYLPFYCGFLLFVFFSLRYLKGESSLILPATLYGVLFCLHFAALVFLPALLS